MRNIGKSGNSNLNSGKVDCTKAHGARFTRSVYFTIWKFYLLKLLTSL